MNLHENKQTFSDAIVATANALNIKRHFVEKDYWICRSLQQMARTDTKHHAIFKGGTSLTKAYNIGSRFSEDIDVAIADAHLMTGNQIKTTIRRVAHGMTEGLTEVVKNTKSKIMKSLKKHTNTLRCIIDAIANSAKGDNLYETLGGQLDIYYH